MPHCFEMPVPLFSSIPLSDISPSTLLQAASSSVLLSAFCGFPLSAFPSIFRLFTSDTELHQKFLSFSFGNGVSPASIASASICTCSCVYLFLLPGQYSVLTTLRLPQIVHGFLLKIHAVQMVHQPVHKPVQRDNCSPPELSDLLRSATGNMAVYLCHMIFQRHIVQFLLRRLFSKQCDK